MCEEIMKFQEVETKSVKISEMPNGSHRFDVLSKQLNDKDEAFLKLVSVWKEPDKMYTDEKGDWVSYEIFSVIADEVLKILQYLDFSIVD